jgi:hypothetical protein
MKIQVLSVEDLSENEKDVVVPADIEASELEEMRGRAELREEDEAQVAEVNEDQVESQTLIDQVVSLEKLYEKISSLQIFTVHHAMEAYDAAPNAHIMETFKSGASQQAKVSVAMEGIMSAAWEAVKRFWRSLVAMWKKLVQYFNRWSLGTDKFDQLKVDQALVTKLEGLVHQAQQRFQANQREGRLVRASVEENRKLAKAWVTAGAGQMPEVFSKLREILPKAGQFSQLIEKWTRDLERWFSESSKHPDAQTVMPASPESQMYDFCEVCSDMSKKIPHFFFGKQVDDIGRVSLNDVLTNMKATPIMAEYGQEQAMRAAAFDVLNYIDKRGKDMERGLDADKGHNMAKLYRAMGQELAAVRLVVVDVMTLFHHTREAQARMLMLGGAYIRAIWESYHAMSEAVNGPYSAEDRKFFENEGKFMLDLDYKFEKILEPITSLKRKKA